MHIESLQVKLTDEDLKARSASLAEKVRELEVAEQNRKQVAAELKEEIESIELKVSDLARIVRNKSEARPVECAEEPDAIHAVVNLIRQDTGEVVSSRSMTASELADARQVKLFEAPAQEKKRGKKAQPETEAAQG